MHSAASCQKQSVTITIENRDNLTNCQEVKNEAGQYFEKLFFTNTLLFDAHQELLHTIIIKQISQANKLFFRRPVETNEIRKDLLKMRRGTALGEVGSIEDYFSYNQDIADEEEVREISYDFENENRYKHVNYTILN